MAELKQGTGNKDRIDFVQEYQMIEESYIPGDTMPPVKNEWRYRYSEYYYEVKLEKEKSLRKLRSDAQPVFRGHLIGVYDKQNCTWKFYSVREGSATITKYVVKIRYILIEETKKSVKVGFRKDQPIPISSIDEEW